MTKIYVMETCPDCTQIKRQAKERPDFQLIDIGEHVKNLKEFIRLRDSRPEFDAAKREGSLGIPCFLHDDGSITFEAADFVTEEPIVGTACSLDKKGGC